MKNAWRIIIMVVLVAILLGGVGVAVGMMTGADFTRIYSVVFVDRRNSAMHDLVYQGHRLTT